MRWLLEARGESWIRSGPLGGRNRWWWTERLRWGARARGAARPESK